MPDTSGREAERLGEAKRRFEQWRRGRRRPGRIPTALWRLAAQAATTQGVERTAEHLQLDAERLEQWVEQLGLIGGAAPAEAEFLELPPLPVGSWAECHLEVEEPSGRKLRLCFKGQAVAQAAAVIPAIWRASP